MHVDTLVVGDLETNCYILSKDNTCLVIDPGDEFDMIKDKIGKRLVLGIIITHYHFDHIGALEELMSYTKSKVYDINNLENINDIEPFTFEMIKTPGHKEDCITIYFREDKVMFTGDFIFFGTIGRTDLKGGSMFDMKRSIKNILEYDDDITLYSGHGPRTTLKDERKTLEYWLSF